MLRYPSVQVQLLQRNDRRAAGWLGCTIKVSYQSDESIDGCFVLQQTTARFVGGELRGVHDNLMWAQPRAGRREPEGPSHTESREVVLMDGTSHWALKQAAEASEVLVYVVAYPVNAPSRIVAVASRVITAQAD